MLKELKENLLFDALVFTDAEGINHLSDGRTSDAAGRDYYVRGMQGETGISVVFDSTIYDETMLCFYAPSDIREKSLVYFEAHIWRRNTARL